MAGNFGAKAGIGRIFPLFGYNKYGFVNKNKSPCFVLSAICIIFAGEYY